MYIKGRIKLKQSDNICVLLTCMKVELTDLATDIIKYANLRTHIRKNDKQIISNNRTNTRCNAIEYRSFYLVVLLAGCSRF